jgi:hypothetical protein
MQQTLIVAQDSAFSRRQVATQFQRDVVLFDEHLELAFKAHEKAVKAASAAQLAASKQVAALATLVAEVAPEAGAALVKYADEWHAAHEALVVAASALPKLSGAHDGPLAAARRSVKAYERACKDADDSNKDKGEKSSNDNNNNDNAAGAKDEASTADDVDGAAGSNNNGGGSNVDEAFAQTRLDVVIDLALVGTVRQCDVPDAFAAVLNAHAQFAHKISLLAAPLETIAQQITAAGRARREQAAVDHAALLSAQINGWPGITAASAAAAATGAAVHHAGFLFVKQTTGVLRDWQRRYFVLHDDRLDFFRVSKDFIVVGSAPVLLLRATPRPSDARSFVFELATPNEQWLVASSSHAEQAAWIEALAARTAHLLESQSRGADDGAAAEKRAALLAELRAVPGNNKCADCGAADPTWTSLNHGALVCVQCSGVHRSLSTAVSKVFSLTLDDLSPAATTLLRSIGNATANGVLERNVPVDARVATTDAAAAGAAGAGANVGGTRGTADERLSRERFARDKYTNGAFVGVDGAPEAAYLCAAVDAGDLAALLRAVVSARTDVALGKVVRGEEPASDKERTLLHRAVALGNTAAVELLLLNGAQTDQAGADGMKPIHVAISRGDLPIAEALLDHRCEVDELAVSMAEASLPAIVPALRESLQRKAAIVLAAAERERQHAEHLAALAADAEKMAAAAAGGAASAADGGDSWSATAWSKIKARRNAPGATTVAAPPGTPPKADSTAPATASTAATVPTAAAAAAVPDDKPEKKDSRFASFKAGLAKKAAAVKEQAANFRNRNASTSPSERPEDANVAASTPVAPPAAAAAATTSTDDAPTNEAEEVKE